MMINNGIDVDHDEDAHDDVSINSDEKFVKIVNNFKNFKYCQIIGQVMFPQHSDQRS